MNFIWEPLIQMMQQEGAPERLSYRIQENHVSPYLELQPDSLYNLYEGIVTEDSLTSVDVNPYLRFESLFEQFVTADNFGYREFNEAFGDVLLHYLADLDLKSGMSKREVYLRFLISDMEKGIFGDAEELHRFTVSEKRVLAKGILELYQTSDYLACMMEAAGKLFPFCQIFIRDSDEIVFYMREERNDFMEKKIRFFLRLFLPLPIPFALHWTKTYGVAGYDKTMKLGEFVL